MLAGIALDLAGLGLVIWSLPEGGVGLAAGVVCLLAGAALTTRAASAPITEQSASTSTTWHMPPALRAKAPRSVKMQPLGRVIALVWIAALIGIGLFAAERVLGLNPPGASHRLVVAEGADVRAEIHDKTVRENSRGEPRYYLYYHYEYPQGSRARASVSVPQGIYDDYQVNDVIALKVLPSEPPAVAIPEFTRDPFALQGLLLGACVAALLLVYLDSQRRRQRRLVSTGLPVSGTVSDIRRRGASRSYHARYQVGGTEHTVRASERNPERRNGDQVTVLHDAEDPGDGIVYEAALYRVVDAA